MEFRHVENVVLVHPTRKLVKFMGTLKDAVREAVEESLKEVREELGSAHAAPSKDVEYLTSMLEELKRKVRMLESRIDGMEGRLKSADSIKSEIVESVLGDEEEILRALRKSVGER